MNSLKIVIVGGGAAGLSAAITSRNCLVDSEITVLNDESSTYRRSALTSVIEGVVQKPREIALFPSAYLSSFKIRRKSNAKAIKLDTGNSTVEYHCSNVSTEKLSFDRLILATGGHAPRPPIEGSDKLGIFTVRTINDALNISKWARKADSASIIGAGFIGLLATEALIKRGVKVNLIEIKPHILSGTLEPDFAATVKKNLEERKVKILTETTAEEIGGDHRIEWIRTTTSKLPSDLLLFTLGVRPNTEIIKDSRIATDKSGIVVDARMQTSVTNVYAAGDCVTVIDAITKNRVYLPIGSLAAIEGSIAGSNAAGYNIETAGFIRVQDEEIFDLHVISMGCTVDNASRAGLKVETLDLMSKRKTSRNLMEPQIKLVTASRRLIGAQIIANKHLPYVGYYSLRLLELVKERKSLNEALTDLKKPYGSIPEYILWKNER